VVIVAGSSGAQIWQVKGDKLLFSYTVDEALKSNDAGDHYFSGIGSSREHISIGTSFGSLLVFSTTRSTSAKDDGPINLLECLSTSKYPISSVTSSSSLLACGNDNGDVFAFNPNAGFELMYRYAGPGYSCTTICQYMDVIYAGYYSGHIRIFRPHIQEMTIEIVSNVRPISGIIVNPGLGVIASCSEDQFVRVWSAPDFTSPSTSGINLLFSDKISNRICTGLGFVRDDKIFVTLYDDDSMIVYERN
jgi:WD40 repeat protein